MIAQFETEIQENPEFAEQIEQNHRDYAARRLALIPPEVQERMKEEYPDRFQVLAESGVGGIRSPEGVKCLHTHVADFLARGENVIGARVLEILNKPRSCSQGQCKEFRLESGN